MKKIRFVSGNTHKISEFREMLKPLGIECVPVSLKIHEIQTENRTELVRDKLLKAFKKIGKPVLVEHTGLYVSAMNGLPAGLTQTFWDKLQADGFARLVGALEDSSLVARTTIGYCDGRQLHFFEGEVSGRVPSVPVGDRAFQWDCVFIPDGETQTFAEMGSRKNEISMRRKAIASFCEFLGGRDGSR